jgi:chloramphenicol-sensitive protein RarD
VTEQRKGTVLGLTAYLCWGLFPLYWPLLEPAGALEILAHRVVWSLVAVVMLLLVTTRSLRSLPRDARRLQLLTAAAVLIGINWGVYIWGVNNHHVVETSLGYFINPLVSVALGVIVLGERLRRAQWSAVAIAAVGVTVLSVAAGRPPWIALTLALSFGTYGLVKRVVGIPAVEGLVVEAAVLAPIAAGYLIVEAAHGYGNFTGHGPGHSLLLMSSGVITAIPLLAFAGAARRVPLSRLGLLQYLTPTIQFLIGVLYRHEAVTTGKLGGFVLVWVALVVFTTDSLRDRSRVAAGEQQPVEPLTGEPPVFDLEEADAC